MPTIDVEITPDGCARATLVGAGTPPVVLEATAAESLEQVVHKFVHSVAQTQNTEADVVYRKGEQRRYLTVNPSGSVETRTPSEPIPTFAAAAAESVPVQVPAGPVVVAAEPIVHTAASTAGPIAHRVQTGPQRTAAPVGGRRVSESVTGPLEALTTLSAPSVHPQTSEPARLGVRGRLNTLFGLTLAPKPQSQEVRLREAAAVIAGPIPESAAIAVVNVKGGVGKTPIALGLAATVATHRGAGTCVCVDLGEVGGSFPDRVAIPPQPGQNLGALLDQSDCGHGLRPSKLGQYLTRQPSGEDIIVGQMGAEYGLSYDDAAAVAALLGPHRDVLVADTGNSNLAGTWKWAVAAAHAVVVPVPLRRDAAAAAQRTLATIAATRPDVLARTVVVITDGPGDAPMVETDAVEAFSALGVPVYRMPFDPLFASGERIALTQLHRASREALTVLAATVLGLMGRAVD